MTTHHDPRDCTCSEHATLMPKPTDEVWEVAVVRWYEFWEARWKEAADQRDERDADAHAWKEHSRALVRQLAKARAECQEVGRQHAECPQQLDAERARAVKAEQSRDEWRIAYEGAAFRREAAERELEQLRAEQPRPLTADDITDEMVDRAHRSLISHHGYGRVIRSQVRSALTAALTPPPKRPEWADAPAVYATAKVSHSEMQTGVWINAGSVWSSYQCQVPAEALIEPVVPLYLEGSGDR